MLIIGFAMVLPFVDEYHIIDLDEQSLDIKPVSVSCAFGLSLVSWN